VLCSLCFLLFKTWQGRETTVHFSPAIDSPQDTFPWCEGRGFGFSILTIQIPAAAPPRKSIHVTVLAWDLRGSSDSDEHT